MPNSYVVDIETYFDKKYSLKNMSMAEYIRDERFRCLLVGWKNLETGETGVLREGEISSESLAFLNGCVFIAHNVRFDAAALVWHYGIRPRYYIDTVGLARAVFPRRKSYSLNALARDLLEDEKLLDLQENPNPDEDDLVRYCLKDVELCARLFRLILKSGLPRSELWVNDLVNRMYIEPVFEVDYEMLEAVKQDVLRRRFIATTRVGLTPAQLRQRGKVIKALEALGVPTPFDPMTGKPTLSKSNPTIRRVLEGDYGTRARLLMEARLLCASTIEETRAQRIIDVARACNGVLPVPLKYYGAHTGRSSGDEKLNLQNMPRGSKLRKALRAPRGHKVVAADASQIEARTLAWWCGETKLVEAFAKGEDVYSQFASVAFGYAVNKQDYPAERYVGKTCILGLGYGVGAEKLLATIRQGAATIKDEAARERVRRLRLSDAERYHATYRSTYARIANRWREIDWLLRKRTGQLDLHPVQIWWDGQLLRTRLPNGLQIVRDFTEENLWYGLVVENVIQALARLVVFDQAVELHRMGYKVALFVHDEIVLVVPDEKVEQCLQDVQRIMRTPPAWAEGLPLDCEAHVGETYGDAK